ncbi:WecB/TagA/CpsF family glycosyltransferase [Planctomycetota bacterium]
MQDVLRRCDEHIQSRVPLLVGVANVAKVVNARRDPELKRSLEEADFIVADGLPIVWLSRCCGHALPERVAGIDIMIELLKQGDLKGYSVYFLGARQEVTEKVVEYTRLTYPRIRVAGYRDGYFAEDQEQEVADDIRNSKADILFVAITPPKKENFLRRWSEYMQVPVCHGVGGSFDVVAGVTERAPLWMQKCALEWFYRVIQEPKRMWKRYWVTNTKFVWLCFGEIVRHRLGHTQCKKP